MKDWQMSYNIFVLQDFSSHKYLIYYLLPVQHKSVLLGKTKLIFWSTDKIAKTSLLVL